MEVAVIGAVAATLAAVLTYLGVRHQSRTTKAVEDRRMSGDIHTSEAADLWKESQDMRQELREEVGRLRSDHNDCEIRVEMLRSEVEDLKGKLRSV